MLVLCPIAVLSVFSCSVYQVKDFLLQLSGESRVVLPPVTCRPGAPLSEAMTVAVINKVHRVWVTEDDGRLVGVVAMTDIIRVCRQIGMASHGGG